LGGFIAGFVLVAVLVRPYQALALDFICVHLWLGKILSILLILSGNDLSLVRG
jgi:hypothetical protein